jgi:hypothetical protein
MRRFHLVRNKDISGVSGTGVVAEGIEFHDGQIAMSWFGQFHTLVVAPNEETVIKIHGHEGATEIKWLD